MLDDDDLEFSTMMKWVDNLDFEKYVQDWQGLATSVPTEQSMFLSHQQ